MHCSNFQNSRIDRNILLTTQSPKVLLHHWRTHIQPTDPYYPANFSMKHEILPFVRTQSKYHTTGHIVCIYLSMNACVCDYSILLFLECFFLQLKCSIKLLNNIWGNVMKNLVKDSYLCVGYPFYGLVANYFFVCAWFLVCKYWC